MPRQVLHVADLHLAVDERDYCLGVLEEIVGLSNSHQVAALLIAGDLFDSYADAEVLRSEVRGALTAAEAPVVYIPGNHEEIKAGVGNVARFDLGDVCVLRSAPFELTTVGRGDDAFEVLGIPFQKDGYADYRGWNVPAKKAPVRLALAHAVVAGMTYGIEDLLADEERGKVMDPDVFVQNGVTYAALGHIHNAPAPQTVDGTVCVLCYAGSARVWRKGESSPRTVCLVDMDTGHPTRIRLASAGEYRAIDVPLDLDGNASEILADPSTWGPNDFLEFRLFGVVEDETVVAETQKRIEQEYKGRVREIVFDRSSANGGVDVLAGVASQAPARRFLAAWKEAEPDGHGPKREVWLRARQLGLLALSKVFRGTQ